MDSKSIISFFSRRRWILLCLLIITPAGFLFKSYSGPGHKWFNDYGAAVMYEIFWCLVIFLFHFRKEATTRIAVGVFLVTCLLEIMQLWQPWLLQQVRSTFLGAALIGNTFVWWDFPHYVMGCFVGWLWMQAISNHSRRSINETINGR